MKVSLHSILSTLLLALFASSANSAFGFTPTRHGIESVQTNISTEGQISVPMMQSMPTNHSVSSFIPTRHGVEYQASQSTKSQSSGTGFKPARHGLEYRN
ncbi:MAG: hypothetical protein KME64_29595 [Scytonematopsis contorta HA4267-MV1]|jgi:hypothetical protein|nr:hypothetical protein [Scytonematopsis contorta HA4267-MV1]